jgi:hypothetical protein
MGKHSIFSVFLFVFIGFIYGPPAAARILH